uniref:Uncharacterized protein n=1 Tax=Rhizophora mucronata TaxID=61149 RepID=A0A2P2PD42_RHIMU
MTDQLSYHPFPGTDSSTPSSKVLHWRNQRNHLN